MSHNDIGAHNVSDVTVQTLVSEFGMLAVVPKMSMEKRLMTVE